MDEEITMPTINGLRKQIEKDYPGVFTIYPVVKIPIGVFTLDLLTGGGIPESRISSFWGAKSSCKTSTALRVANQFLIAKPGMKVIYVDFEHTYDETWTKHFITDMSRFVYIAPDFGEEGVDIMAKLFAADDACLGIVDSVAMMIPRAESEASMLDDFMCKHPRLVNRMFRRIAPIMSQSRKAGRNFTLLLINQPMYDIGVRSFQPIMKKPGGIRQDMLASLDIRFYPGLYKKVGEVSVKVTNTFVIEKNKVGLPRGRGEFTMYLAPYEGHKVGDIDEVKTLLTYAKRADLMVRDGTKWDICGKKYDTLEHLAKIVMSKPSELEDIKRQVLAKLIANPVSTVDEEKEEKDA